MRELVDLLVEFNAPCASSGKRLAQARVQNAEPRQDARAVGQARRLAAADLQGRLPAVGACANRLSVDHLMMERTYRIEASVGQLVAERVRATGDPRSKVVAVLSGDPAAGPASPRMAAWPRRNCPASSGVQVGGQGGPREPGQEDARDRWPGGTTREELAAIATAVNAAAARCCGPWRRARRDPGGRRGRRNARRGPETAGPGAQRLAAAETKKSPCASSNKLERYERQLDYVEERARLCGHQISGAPRRRRDVLSAQ